MNLKQNSVLQGGKYKIEKVLGQGGFGITYLATQVALQRKVAIKEFFMKSLCNRDNSTSQVSVGSSGSIEMVERFRQKFIKEALNIAEFNHPNIIRIYDVFEENETAYYVMEYIDNGSLSSYGKISEDKATRYIRQIADALAYIHSRCINHLDIKPGNILLNDLDNAVLIDFGLSKRYDSEGHQTSTTPVGISHGYAPVEQYKQGGVGTFSPSTDIYALGATFYKLLTGQVPPDANEIFDDGLPPLPAEVSESTRKAIIAAMQPQRKNRPQSVAEFLYILDAENISNLSYDVSEETELVSAKSMDSESEENDMPKTSKRKYIFGGIVTAVLIVLGAVSFSYLGGSPEISENLNDTISNVVGYRFVNGNNVAFSYSGAVNRDTIPNGKGVGEYEQGTYTGLYENGLRHGKGHYVTAKGTNDFEGLFEFDVYSEGKLTSTEGWTYEGNFKNQNFNRGRLYFADGTYFDGEFKDNNPYNGVFYSASGVKAGNIRNGEIY